MQISPIPGGDNVTEDQDGDEENEALNANQPASDTVNRSSSFLFDSLYDSSLLAGLSPHYILDQSDEEEPVGQEIRDRCSLQSTQERRRSELLANQEAEQQEAIQWGESSFSLSEWGDSLLVGEHFLERQNLLRHTDGTVKEQGASHCKYLKPSIELVLPEGQTSESRPQPSQIQPIHTTATTDTQSEDTADKSRDTYATNNHAEHRNKTGGKHEEKIKKGELSTLISDNAHFKYPLAQNAPESTFYCSPGLQEIFDLWPSMSEQPCQNAFTSHVTNTTEVLHLPQPSRNVARKRTKGHIAASERDSRKEHPSKHDSEDIRERLGTPDDLIPPTQETPPVTPKVKLTTSSVQSPLVTQPVNRSTPSTLLQRKPAVTECPKFHPGYSKDLSEVAADSKQANSACTSDCSLKHLGQKLKSLPVPRSNSKLEIHVEENVSSHQDCASPSKPLPELLADKESPVIDEGFTLQLSQDASLCSGNSGTFAIIDVASDRRLFETFMNEWKTKERYCLALACEKKEPRQQREGEIGGKHKRGNLHAHKLCS